MIEFRLMSRYASNERWYKDDEIVPVSELSLSCMRVREDTRFMLSGIDPFRPNPLNSMLVTLPVASQASPAHEHSCLFGVGGEEPVHVHPD